MKKNEQKAERMNIAVKTKNWLNDKSGDLLLYRRRQSLRRAGSSVPNAQNALLTSYTYNTRGWIKTIAESKTGFRQTLYYQDHPTPAKKLYNGNISQMTYQYSMVGASTAQIPTQSLWSYTYDGLNRLTNAELSPGLFMQGKESMNYDKQGNPTYIYRKMGATVSDISTISYNGNQKKGIQNSVWSANPLGYPASQGTFKYDQNGSMTADTGREIMTIRYNSLNLPDTIQFENGSAIYYTYDAAGMKLRTKHITVKPSLANPISVTMGSVRPLTQSETLSELTTDYVGNHIIEDGVLTLTQFAGGYTRRILSENNTCGTVYYYYQKDYLGNNLDVLRLNDNGIGWKHLQQTEYTPFGVSFPQMLVSYPLAQINVAYAMTVQSGIVSLNQWWLMDQLLRAGSPSPDDMEQPFKFGGKELDLMHNLYHYDFHARMYDPLLQTFPTQDPLKELNYHLTPYHYASNNPINRIDPDGRDDYEVNSKTGHFFFIRHSEEHTLYITGARGGRTGQSLTLKDNSIFEGLANTAKNNDWKKSFSIGDANSQDAMLKTFKFLADNTGVEWRVDKFRENGKTMYGIGTAHTDRHSITSEQMGHTTKSVIAFVHSHPNANLDRETWSMGWRDPNRFVLESDVGYKTNNEHYRNASYNTYFPKSGNLWNVKVGQKPAFIRNVNTHKGFFGTFNTR